MNPTEPLGQLQKPATGIPSMAQVSRERKTAASTVLQKIRTSYPRSSRIPDAVFGVIILLSAISVFAIVVLVAWELIDKSRLSLHQFGIHFFYGHDWDPVNDSFGAMPFIYGTLVSSFLALLLAVPLSVGRGGLHHRDVSPAAAGLHFIHGGTAGRHPQRHLRIVGHLRTGSAACVSTWNRFWPGP